MGDDHGEKKEKGSDVRVDWFINRVGLAWGKMIKPEKLTKLSQNNEATTALSKFCDSDDRCVFVFEADGELQASSRVPAPDKMGKKILAFFKAEQDAGVTMQDVPKKISSAEVGGNALRQLMTMSKDVYFPLLTNPGNQKGWPEVIVKEFTENLHRFMAQTFVTMGHMNGETLLPLPPDDVYTNMEKNQQDKESIHVLETAVIAWTRQIKDILRQDPESALKGDGHPGPTAEIEFWASKSTNLNLINDQLNSEPVRKVMKVLEVTKSTYFPPSTDFARKWRKLEWSQTTICCTSRRSSR